MNTAYCGACGAQINAGARFCRACGRPQQPTVSALQASPPPLRQEILIASLLAIAGGTVVCFLVLYAALYEPLHGGYPVYDFDEPWFGDIFTLVAGGAAAIAGALTLGLRPVNTMPQAVLLAVTGGLVLILTLVWAFFIPFGIELYPAPLYAGRVFFADVARVELGDVFLVLPLLAASSAVVIAAVLMAGGAPRGTIPAPAPR